MLCKALVLVMERQQSSDGKSMLMFVNIYKYCKGKQFHRPPFHKLCGESFILQSLYKLLSLVQSTQLLHNYICEYDNDDVPFASKGFLIKFCYSPVRKALCSTSNKTDGFYHVYTFQWASYFPFIRHNLHHYRRRNHIWQEFCGLTMQTLLKELQRRNL
jgi:hypothetical protein